MAGPEDLLRDWQNAMRSLASSAASTAAKPIPDQLLAPLQRQLELMEEVLVRERRFQGELVSRVLGPLDDAFDLLEQSAGAVRQQSRALNESAQALQQAAQLMEVQADLFERTIRTLRQPAELAKQMAGAERRAEREKD